MKAYYGDRISPHMTESPEGYLICHDVPIARTGPQEYLAKVLYFGFKLFTSFFRACRDCAKRY